LSRHDGKFDPVSEVAMDASELLAALGARDGRCSERKAAIACYLSGGDGWRQAKGLLDGAFAADVVKDPAREG